MERVGNYLKECLNVYDKVDKDCFCKILFSLFSLREGVKDNENNKSVGDLDWVVRIYSIVK